MDCNHFEHPVLGSATASKHSTMGGKALTKDHRNKVRKWIKKKCPHQIRLFLQTGCRSKEETGQRGQQEATLKQLQDCMAKIHKICMVYMRQQYQMCSTKVNCRGRVAGNRSLLMKVLCQNVFWGQVEKIVMARGDQSNYFTTSPNYRPGRSPIQLTLQRTNLQ